MSDAPMLRPVTSLTSFVIRVNDGTQAEKDVEVIETSQDALNRCSRRKRLEIDPVGSHRAIPRARVIQGIATKPSVGVEVIAIASHLVTRSRRSEGSIAFQRVVLQPLEESGPRCPGRH